MTSRPEGVPAHGRTPAQPQAKRTAVVAGNRRKIHTTFPDGSEMVEEYDIRTNDLLVRKRRGRSMLGAVQNWVYICGQPMAPSSSSTPSNVAIRESSSAPVLVRKDTISTIEFRIRNLFYPASTYDVSVDERTQQIVIRTSNNKYYKRITIPEISELNIPLNARFLTWQYGNNTLLLVYKKPMALIEKEEKHRQEIINDPTIREEGQNTGDCRQQ